MAIFYDAPVPPDTLTAFIRELPTPGGLTLLGEFPVVNVPTNVVNFSEITQTNRAARYRAFDGRVHVADRDGYSDKVIKMAPFSDSLNMGEYERLQLEYQRTGGTRSAALEQAIYNDATTLTRYMTNRMNLALGDVLADGTFTTALASEFGGVTDFGVPAGNLITAGTAWATYATADGIADLISACDVYEAATGTRPGTAYISRSLLRAFQVQTKVINAVRGAQTGVSRIALQDAFSIFDSEGIPTRWVVVEDAVDVDGSTTRVFPTGKLALGPADPAELMEFRVGLSATALELVNSGEAEMTFEEAPGIVGVIEKVGPPYRQFTFVDAVGMPILKDAKKLVVVSA